MCAPETTAIATRERLVGALNRRRRVEYASAIKDTAVTAKTAAQVCQPTHKSYCALPAKLSVMGYKV